MKVVIKDKQTLASLDPAAVACYLQAHGWQQVEQIGDKGTVWTRKNGHGKEYEILLPVRPNVGDFVLRMADVINTLEVVEERSQLDILKELTRKELKITLSEVDKLPAISV